MTVEEHLETAITTAEAIVPHFTAERPVAEWYFASSSLGLGPNLPIPDRPYIVVNELTDRVHQEVKETSHARDRNFQIFVYDHKGDFTRINKILEDLRDVVKGLAPFEAPDGTWCSASEWGGISGQATDDAYDSVVRFGNLKLTVNR